MRSTFKKNIAMAMAALMCAGSLAACASDADTPNPSVTTAAPTQTEAADVTTAPAETEEPRITPNVPAANFAGHKFNVLTKGQSSATWYSRDIYSEGITGEVISDAVYKRNKKIEEIYNFEVVEIGSSDPANDAKNSIMAQNDEYDMICIRLKDHITSLITQGYLLNLNNVELMDLSQPYYDQSAMESLSIGGKNFAITGDLLTMDNDATRCVLFNKSLFNNLGLEKDPAVNGTLYDAVKDGRWTLEMLEACSMAATADIDGDQQMTNADRWGMANEQFNTLALYNAAGLLLFEKDENDLPVFKANSERSLTALQRIIPMMNADYTLFYSNAYEQVHPYFKEGNILFHLAQLAEVTLYRAMEFDFGIIPLPKYTAEQERYYSPVTAYGSNCISIPITASNIDRTATIIEALSCESMYTVTPAYYEVALKGKMLRDEESTEMLDVILSTTVFELGYMWNWGSIYNSLSTATTSNNTNLSSLFKALDRVATKAMQTSVDTILALD
ncbi:MAG: extracellular solute-binding protein [Clostridia bacterium]|nr:extracellular solute-binding protein [Clostridia bacterium]